MWWAWRRRMSLGLGSAKELLFGVASALDLQLNCCLPPQVVWLNCKTDVLSGTEWIMHLEQVRRYHPCTCTRYNGTTLVPARGTTVPPLYLNEVQRYHPCTCTRYNGHLPRCYFSIKKRQEFHKRTTSRYKGGTVVPSEGTGVVPSYLLRVQGWYRRTSWGYRGGTIVPPEGTGVVPSCLPRYRRTSWGYTYGTIVLARLSPRRSIHSPNPSPPPALETVTTPNRSWSSMHSKPQFRENTWSGSPPSGGGRQRRTAKT